MDCEKCVYIFIFEKRFFCTICIILLQKMRFWKWLPARFFWRKIGDKKNAFVREIDLDTAQKMKFSISDFLTKLC